MGKILLGIDYGEAKIGLAISSGPLAAPLSVVRFDSPTDLLAKLKKIIFEEHIEGLVMGISDGVIAEKAKAIGSALSLETNLPVSYVDETLTSKDAQAMSIEAGINRKKRKSMEDAFAASLILQSYLDNNS